MVKYHINRKGVPAICKQTTGKCPFGDSNEHYSSESEAQLAADRINEEKFGLFVGQKEINEQDSKEQNIVKFAETTEDKLVIEKKLDRMRKEAGKNSENSYILRMKRSEKLETYEPNGEVTFHYKEERAAREDLIKSQLGEGKPIGYYKVNHMVKDNFYQDQVFEVLNNGQVRIYDNNNGKLVTTFIPTRQRLEIVMLSAGDIPDELWIKDISKEKRIFDNNWDKVKDLYSKKKEGRFSKKNRARAKYKKELKKVN